MCDTTQLSGYVTAVETLWQAVLPVGGSSLSVLSLEPSADMCAVDEPLIHAATPPANQRLLGGAAAITSAVCMSGYVLLSGMRFRSEPHIV